MASTPSFTTVRNPALSLWQSVVHSKLLRHAAAGKTELPDGHRGLGTTAGHPVMSATAQAIQNVQDAVSPAPATMHGPPHPDDLRICAELAARLAWAGVFDREKVPQLRDEFKDSVCDPFWMECFLEYEKLIHTGGTQPYLKYKDIGDFVVNDCFGNKATVAIIGDWGTGMNDAVVLLQQIANNFKPDVLIHLGDIYYSGLPSECKKHFSDVMDEVWPKDRPLVYVLDGNHDRYAGSNGGYYPMITRLNADKKFMQPNSYFCLRNDFWQFVAMDTGYHDTDPFSEYRNVTYLEDSEAEWVRDKVRGNGAGVDAGMNPSGVRGTVLLSHHQLISQIGVGRDAKQQLLPVNPHLAEAVAPVGELVDFWLWGHEHDLRVFEPYSLEGQQLPLGRCVGAGAVPVFVEGRQAQGEADPELLIPSSETGPPCVVEGTALGNNGEVMNHAYAIMTLDGPALTIDYYQIDSTGASVGAPPALNKISYSDRVEKPKAARVHAVQDTA